MSEKVEEGNFTCLLRKALVHPKNIQQKFLKIALLQVKSLNTVFA